MTTHDGKLRMVRVTSREAMSFALAEVALFSALELMLGGGYPRPTEKTLAGIAQTIALEVLAIPHLVHDMAAVTDDELEQAARDLGARVVCVLLGPAPALN